MILGGFVSIDLTGVLQIFLTDEEKLLMSLISKNLNERT